MLYITAMDVTLRKVSLNKPQQVFMHDNLEIPQLVSHRRLQLHGKKHEFDTILSLQRDTKLAMGWC